MAEITAANVGKLREMTGAGMMDCKKALTEAGGDIDKAVDILRKKGAATASVKAARDAKDGAIAQYIAPGGKSACWWKSIARPILWPATRSSALSARKSPSVMRPKPNPDLETERQAMVAKIRENIKIARHAKMEVTGNGMVAGYIHTGAKVGVLVEVGAGKAETDGKEEFKQLVRDITLQIAAGHPHAVSREHVPADVISQGTRNRRAIRPLQRQAAPGHGENPAGCPGQVLPDLLPGGPGLREAQF